MACRHYQGTSTVAGTLTVKAHQKRIVGIGGCPHKITRMLAERRFPRASPTTCGCCVAPKLHTASKHPIWLRAFRRGMVTPERMVPLLSFASRLVKDELSLHQPLTTRATSLLRKLRIVSHEGASGCEVCSFLWPSLTIPEETLAHVTCIVSPTN